MDKDGKLIDLSDYRRRQQRALGGKGLKERVLKAGATLLLGGLASGAVLLAFYGAYNLIRRAPPSSHQEVSKEYSPMPIEREFLPAEEKLVEYLPDNGSREGVRVKKVGYNVLYYDTNRDHTVDQIIINDNTAGGLSPLEEKVDFMPIGSANFNYGTELLREEREKYFKTHDRK